MADECQDYRCRQSSVCPRRILLRLRRREKRIPPAEERLLAQQAVRSSRNRKMTPRKRGKREKTMQIVINSALILALPVLVAAGGSPNSWVLGEAGASCETACTNAGGTCNAINTGALNEEAKMRFVESILPELSCNDFYQELENALSPARVGDRVFLCYYQGSTETTCPGSNEGAQRICCCSDNLADCPVSMT